MESEAPATMAEGQSVRSRGEVQWHARDESQQGGPGCLLRLLSNIL